MSVYGLYRYYKTANGNEKKEDVIPYLGFELESSRVVFVWYLCDIYFLILLCFFGIIHLNYNEKSTLRFICDLVNIICYIGLLVLVINKGMFACILFCTSLGLDLAIACQLHLLFSIQSILFSTLTLPFK